MSSLQAWLVLLVAGLCEVGWAVGMKYTDGFSRLWPSVWTVALMIASVVLLGWALKVLPLGTAYAIWTGIGAVGTIAVGMIWFDEPFGWPRVLFASMAIAGLAGLKATSGH